MGIELQDEALAGTASPAGTLDVDCLKLEGIPYLEQRVVRVVLTH